MSRSSRTPPTRHGLLRAKQRLQRIERGADLLVRKRRALVAELFHLARPAVDARERLQESARRAYRLLLHSLAARDEVELRSLGWPTRDLAVEIRPVNIWGTEAAEISRVAPLRRGLADRGTVPALTGPAAAETADAFEQLIEAVLDNASHEIAVQRLGEALARASRQLNTLEKRVQPALLDDVARLRRTLDEREREDHTRLARLARSGRGGRR